MDFNRGLPGETPLDDTSGLKLSHIHTRGQLFDAEEESISSAVMKYLGKRPSHHEAPFTRKWVLALHREMFGKIWKWAGKTRTTSETRPGVPPRLIDTELQKLVEDIEYWQDHRGDAVEQAAMLHHRAVWIHPFENGNGRWSRLLSQVWQYQQSGAFAIWPNDDIYRGTSSIRNDYIDALRQADDGDLDPLIRLHEKYTVRP